MLLELRPESSVLLPLLRDRFATSDPLPHRQSVYLAGAFADVPAEASDWLSGVITNTAEENWTRTLAVQSLVWIGGVASNVFRRPSARRNPPPEPSPSIPGPMVGIGQPRSLEALPWIEPTLSSDQPVAAVSCRDRHPFNLPRTPRRQSGSERRLGRQ